MHVGLEVGLGAGLVLPGLGPGEVVAGLWLGEVAICLAS